MLLGRPGCGAQAGERGGQLGGPGPLLVDLEVPGAGGAGESGGDVQQPVAQRRRLAAGQFAVQAEHLGPGEQVGRGQGQFEPDLVLVIAARAGCAALLLSRSGCGPRRGRGSGAVLPGRPVARPRCR